LPLTPSSEIEAPDSQEQQRETAVDQVSQVADQPIMHAENPHEDEAYKANAAGILSVQGHFRLP
jgi:hypothetical protein